jgi:hypothetical protein
MSIGTERTTLCIRLMDQQAQILRLEMRVLRAYGMKPQKRSMRSTLQHAKRVVAFANGTHLEKRAARVYEALARAAKRHTEFSAKGKGPVGTVSLMTGRAERVGTNRAG